MNTSSNTQQVKSYTARRIQGGGICLFVIGIFFIFLGVALTLHEEHEFIESSNRTMRNIGYTLLCLGVALVIISVTLCCIAYNQLKTITMYPTGTIVSGPYVSGMAPPTTTCTQVQGAQPTIHEITKITQPSTYPADTAGYAPQYGAIVPSNKLQMSGPAAAAYLPVGVPPPTAPSFSAEQCEAPPAYDSVVQEKS